MNRNPWVASSEREETSCPLDLFSLHFIYSVKSQRWHIHLSSNLIYAVCGLKFHSVCSVDQGLLYKAGQFLFNPGTSILWWIIPESYLPNVPTSRLFIPWYSNKHLVWGYNSVKNNSSKNNKLGGSWLAIPLSCLSNVLVWVPQHSWDKKLGVIYGVIAEGTNEGKVKGRDRGRRVQGEK